MPFRVSCLSISPPCMKIPFFHSKNKAGHGILNFRTPLFHGHRDKAPVYSILKTKHRLMFILPPVQAQASNPPLQNGFEIIKKLRV